MPFLTESDIEQYALELLEAQGYDCLYGPDIAPGGHNPLRKSFDEVLLFDMLEAAVARINPNLSRELREDAVRQLARLRSADLMVNNETFHRFFTEGVPVTSVSGGYERGDRVMLVDFEHPETNDFTAVNQFTIIENHINKRPDIILFINGIPLVVIELKNAADENADIASAWKQIQTYKEAIPSLFTFNSFAIISDGLEARAGTISSGQSRFMAWKSADGRKDASGHTGQIETLIKGMLNTQTLPDLIRHFIVFEKTRREDSKGITAVETVKKLAAYHQYYAVNKAVESTLRASGYVKKSKGIHKGIGAESENAAAEDPESYGLPGVKTQPLRDRKGGVIWHTQGSGKSLSMVFFTGKIILAMDNPTVVVITDRNDLDDQLFDTFSASKQLLRQEPVQAESRGQLKELLKVVSGGVVFTTIQKFQPEDGSNLYEELSKRENIIVIADEAHRSQYGFTAKTLDEKNEAGEVIGKKTVYGFAKYLRDALPNATYLGFTGTPIESADVNTPAVFGNYVDIYDIAQAVEDGATVRIYYETRLAKISLSDEGKRLIQEFDDDLEMTELAETQKAQAKWAQLEALVGSSGRIKKIALDIVTHFEQRQTVLNGKAMIVAMSRRIAAALYEEITVLRPEWHNSDLDKGSIKVVMTSSSSDGPEISKHHTTKDQRRKLSDRMKNPHDELRLVIVRDMWLTGFDVPALHTLYIDKPMRGHNLMQAIARVNRVYLDKKGGLIVDYLGIASDLKDALSFYSASGGRGDPAETQEQAVSLMLEKLEVVSQLFHGFDYSPYFSAGTGQKLSLILAAEEHILQQEDGRRRFLDQVTALSQAFAIAVPHDKAMDVKDEVAFFQAVKARLAKFDGPASDETVSGKSSGASAQTASSLETAIRQIVDQALVTSRVIDVYEAAGIKKPDISILSEEFLMDVKNMEHKHLAMEVLRKLLADEIRARLKTNLVEGKTLMEMLENSIKNYQNKIVTAAEVIDELISLARDIHKRDTAFEELKLTEYEYAFYTAVANNESARELMGKEQLRELAVVLYRKVKENASIDWTIREDVRAKLKVTVKRLLREYGYPPDMEALATETVLQQAEKIADELA
ncbi:putative type-1 restriction enzyme MjaXP R protein (Putative type I restriction enzyme MjaXP R protein) [Leadbettera azotonutricia ZAS-9]|uniref:Type I restriction enzyme endonuclease subunit n=2 Tax=Leadbettera azotonutricia TaxID=150829 RepID=F5YFU1_LEAAZ|nr:putative type-1 restriction enzyme MjaXP R protein (Putative type I restriction enzyme MjaXP R protein) [Leadbettera azotonutricia ZAS-9]